MNKNGNGSIWKFIIFALSFAGLILGAVYFILDFTLKPLVIDMRLMRSRMTSQEIELMTLKETIKDIPALLRNGSKLGSSANKKIEMQEDLIKKQLDSLSLAYKDKFSRIN